MKQLISKIFVLFILLPGLVMAQQLIGVTSGGGQSPNNPGAVVSIDSATGNLTVLGAPFGGVGLSGIAEALDGTVYVSTSVSFDDTSHLLIIDPVTGGLISDLGSMLDSQGNGCGIGDLSIDPTSGILYGLASNQSFVGTSRCGAGGVSTGGYLVVIDPVTAVYTLLGREASIGNNQGGIAFSNLGDLYFSMAWSPDGDLHTLSLADGSFIGTISLSNGLGFHALGADLSTNTLYATMSGNASTADLYTIDPGTGTVTLVSTISGGDAVHDVLVLSGAAIGFPVLAIPTLSGWGIMALILFILIFVAYRRRATTTTR